MTETSDTALIDLMRVSQAMSVLQLAGKTGVTATAVRQRLNRLMGEGLVSRRVVRTGRGRPSHVYSLKDHGLRCAGNNYSDLALALWKVVRSVDDPSVKRGLLGRIANVLAEMYVDRVNGHSMFERMESLSRLLSERRVPFQAQQSGELPVLSALACPYPDLARDDRSVCAMEQMLFSEVLGQRLRLSACRLDGAACCTFEPTC
ncbi:MAG: helix-turn-helix transcriptional regulator [Pirellulales bacterium]